MTKEFIKYTEALVLKELGFDEHCFGVYIAGQLIITYDSVYNSTDVPVVKAPTYSQSFRWFREKYGLDSAVLENRYVIETKEDLPNWHYGFKTYEESELACLIKLIGIVKNK